MPIGLVGRKCGMTRVFTETGETVPVTVIEVMPNKITQIKTSEVDGYEAVQVTAGVRKSSKINKAEAGHFAKAGVEGGSLVREFRLDSAELSALTVGQSITVDIFQPGQIVDVQGTSKGKGFAGTVKRHNFRTQDATHGNSRSHRVPGSTGQNQTPGRVFKGKKMAGHLGDVTCSVQNQKIVKVDVERNLLLVSGGVPGAPGGELIIRKAVKSREKA